jgi:signal transduction histidine kinase
VEIQIEAPAAVPLIWADADRIRQVIGNLISNALRYTSSGGVVIVKVEEQKSTLAGQTPLAGPTGGKSSLPENAPRQPSELLVSVTDSGCGIPEADLPQIFERFYRSDKSRSRASGGSGLGLAIVKHIIEAHGGRVWAESPVWNTDQQQGPGTRISFTLPTLISTRTG